MIDITGLCLEHSIPEEYAESVAKIIEQFERQVADIDAESTRVRIGADDIIAGQAKKYRDLQWRFEMLKQTIRNANHEISGEIMKQYRINVQNQKILLRNKYSEAT